MATEKILSTKIKLRYDSYSNWTAKNPTLLDGEVAIAYIETPTATQEVGSVDNSTSRQVLMKVGPGAYNSLQFLSAKAADVHTWAKKNEAEFTAWVKTLVTVDDIDLSKYVEKETGKSLVADTEIARLAAMSDGANKVESSATNGNIKIDGVETTVYEHPDKHVMDDITGLGAEFDKKVDKVDGKSLIADTEITRLAGMSDGANKVEKSNTNGNIKIDGVETVVYTHPDKHAISDITNLEITLAGKANNANTLAGYGINNAYTKAEVDDLIQEAKDHADDNDANFTYSIAYDSTNKKIQLVGANGGATTDIDATAFIKDGMIETVALGEDSKSLVITWNTDAGKEKSVTTIPLSGLVDVYTGIDGTTVKVNVSSDNKIGAEVKAGTITTSHIAAKAGIVKTQLADNVQTSLGKADSALQAADLKDLEDASHTHSNEAVLNTITSDKVEAWDVAEDNAEKYADNLNTAMDTRVKALEAINHDAYKTADETILSNAKAYADDVLNAAKAYADENDTDTTYTAAANGGLKLDGTAFSIDDSVTFIFNCGDANI